MAGPDGLYDPVMARNSEGVRIPVVSDACHRGCAYKVFQTVKMSGVCSAVHGTVHYKEHLKSFNKSTA